MRWAVVVMSIAGCYTPAGDCRDPANPVCVFDDGMTGDDATNPDDGVVDASTVTTCVTGTFANHDTVSGAVGSSYSRNVSSLAVFENAAGGIRQIDGTVATVAFSPPSSDTFTLPKLAPLPVNGQVEMFLVAIDGVSRSFVKSTRAQGTTWNAPTTVTTNLSITAGFVHGQPTATIPRRMMVSNGVTISEGKEDGTGAWEFGPPITFSGIANATQPSLSADGLVVVFLGSAGGGVFRPFIATRADVMTTSFQNPVALVDNPDGTGTESHPTFSTDCAHIFVSFDSSRVIDLF